MLELLHIQSKCRGAWQDPLIHPSDKYHPRPNFNSRGAVMLLRIRLCHMDQGTRSISKPLKWGHLFLARRISIPLSVLATFLWLPPSQGAVTHNLVGTNLGAFMLLGELKISVLTLSREASTPPNKVGMPLLTPTKQGGITSIPAKWAQIPNRGCISSQTSFTPECLRVVLGCMAPNIPILRIPRTHSCLRSSHFWKLLSFPTCLN